MIRKSAFFYTFIFLFIFVSTYVLCDIASNQHELEYLTNSVNLFSIVAAGDRGVQAHTSAKPNMDRSTA